jgi:hypothetical protein
LSETASSASREGRLNAEAELDGWAGPPRDRPVPPDAAGAIDFTLGCLTHTTWAPSEAPPYTLIETPHYRRVPTQVARPATGTWRGPVSCPVCGRQVALKVGSPGAVLRRRAARLLLAVALIIYIVAVYSGPTGQIGEGRALLLLIAFPSTFVALGALFQAFFGDDADLALKIAEDPGDHQLD